MVMLKMVHCATSEDIHSPPEWGFSDPVSQVCYSNTVNNIVLSLINHLQHLDRG